MGAALNAAYLLKRTIPPRHEEWHGYLDLIRSQITDANEVINQFRAISRGEPPSRKQIALETVIAQARSRIDAGTEIKWQYACCPDPFLIHVDPTQWERVLRNLFLNSVEAITAPGTIRVEATRRQGYDEMVVSDTGRGIPADTLPYVFEPLFTTKRDGTGLGLSICRHIVEHHGGTIQAWENRREAGASFRIRLPHQEAARREKGELTDH